MASDVAGSHDRPMRAVVKSGPGRGCDFVTDRVEPSLRAGEVRLAVAAASVCGSDAAFYDHGAAGTDLSMTFPRTMGHEVGATVVEVGPDVARLRVGDRVAVETHLHCGECWFCTTGNGHNCTALQLLGVTVDGAFAERLVVNARSCFVLPEGIETDVAALLEPAGSALHAILRVGKELDGESVLVTGAGPIGLVAAQLSRALGARHVTVVETNPYRRGIASEMGFNALDADAEPLASADPATRSRGGFDLALECSGAAPAFRASVAAVRREAVVVAVGLVKREIPLSVSDTLITRGLTLRGAWGRSIWETWDRLAPLVATRQIDLAGLVTHRLPISALPQALDLMLGDACKVLLDPSLPDG